MDDKAEDKIAKKLFQIHWGIYDASIDAEWDFQHPKVPWREKAKLVLQALLSDPDIPIIEIDPDAKLPLNPARSLFSPGEPPPAIDFATPMESRGFQAGYEQSQKDMLEAGWVEKK